MKDLASLLTAVRAYQEDTDAGRLPLLSAALQYVDGSVAAELTAVSERLAVAEQALAIAERTNAALEKRLHAAESEENPTDRLEFIRQAAIALLADPKARIADDIWGAARVLWEAKPEDC